MNNEPVAWISEETLKHCIKGNEICVRKNDEIDADCTIPLYTHPAKELTMTFEEMYPIAEKHLGHAIGLYNWKIFADAILRKAQKKC